MVMKKFTETLNYSSFNEDSNSEIMSLKIKEDDNVLCITGSGSRVLSLLTQAPLHITAIDMNPCQNYLLELKLAAIKEFEYDDYLNLLGVYPSGLSEKYYRYIRNLISPEAKSYWDNNIRLIQSGLFYEGRWEKFFSKLAFFLNTTRRKSLNELFECSALEEQKQLWDSKWNSSFWQFFLNTGCSGLILRYFLNDPGFFKYTQAGFSPNRYIKDRFNEAARNILFNSSPFLNLLFRGKLCESTLLPPCLDPEFYSKIKNNSGKVNIITGNIKELLKKCGNNLYNVYSVSDISSYSSPAEYKQIWCNLHRSAAGKARICERQFLVKRDIPSIVSHYFSRDHSLEKYLSEKDTSVFYTFIIATLK
jgi:S-adenosylmethionine-diacylglycerol 3-amino-3-carboxypropyl transferase